MPDTTPNPSTSHLPAPTWIQALVTSLLPQFIAFSRKGLIWFSSLSLISIGEITKQAGAVFGWTDAATLQWQNRVLLIQSVVMLVATLWTGQIEREDSALKTALPPPPQNVAGGNITVQGTPPVVPPKGDGD